MDYDRTVYEESNPGNNRTVSLLNLIESLETALGIKANIKFLHRLPGLPSVTELDDGLREFVNWLRV